MSIDLLRGGDRPGGCADIYKDARGIEFRFRVKRFQHVKALIDAALLEHDVVDILDMGGSEKYWLVGEEYIERHKDRLRFTILNPEPQEITRPRIFTYDNADGCDESLYAGRTFAVVHSNSVIEHVGDEKRTMAFANNIRRLGQRYYVQTPDYWFPYEPHFRFFGYQYLPPETRMWLLTKRNLGFFPKLDSIEAARPIVEEINLLDKRGMEKMFPDATIFHERFFGLSKSLMAVKR